VAFAIRMAESLLSYWTCVCWSHSEWQAIGAGKLNRISLIHDNYVYLLNSE